jgi:predicted anti-sigma-YlaC factor YlaD
LAEPVQVEVSCRHVWKEISNYHDGEISSELRLRIQRHLDGCNHCRAIYDGLRNTVTLIADDHALELPADVSGRLYSKLRHFLAGKS